MRISPSNTVFRDSSTASGFSELNRESKGSTRESTPPLPQSAEDTPNTNRPSLSKRRIFLYKDEFPEGEIGSVKETQETEPLKTSTSSRGSKSRTSSHSDHIKEVSKLFHNSGELKRVSSEHPLSPFFPRRRDLDDIEGNANDVYISDKVVFKPGVVAAMKSKVCFGLIKLFGQLENVIVAAKEGKATVVSREDYKVERVKVYNPEAKQTYLYAKHLMDDKVILRDKKVQSDYIEGMARDHLIRLLPVHGHKGFYLIDESRESDGKLKDISQSDEWEISSEDWNALSTEWDESSSRSDQELFCQNSILSQNEEIERIAGEILKEESEISEEWNEESILGHYVMHIAQNDSVDCQGNNEKDTFKLQMEEDTYVFVENDWLEDDLIINKSGKEYVRRNDQDYRVKEINGRIKVVGKNIPGMVQLKVQHIFQKPESDEIPLNLLEESEAREEFYSRIDMPSFIYAFIATILLRPQDGKVDDLGESNVLFQAIANEEGVIDPLNSSCKLRPIIIDLDDTMPAFNDYLRTQEGITDIHIVKNGLMGFPQARCQLEEENQQITLGVLNEVIAKKQEANEFLKRFIGKGNSNEFNQAHLDAYNQIVDKLYDFISTYEGRKWSLQDLFFVVFPEYEAQWNLLGDLSPERKAQFIGKNSLENSLKLSERYKTLTGTKSK